MKWKWNYFVMAVLLAGYLLISRGAPIVPVALGIAAAALFFGLRKRAA